MVTLFLFSIFFVGSVVSTSTTIALANRSSYERLEQRSPFTSYYGGTFDEDFGDNTPRKTFDEAKRELQIVKRLQENYGHSSAYSEGNDEEDGGSAVSSDDDLNTKIFFDASRFRRRRIFAAMSSAQQCPLPDRCAPHGFCVGDNVPCQCDGDATRGFWSGSTCSDCAYGWAGVNCTIECSGGFCNPCNGNGLCQQGVTGNGVCTCYADPSRGYWGGANCSTCDANYFGKDCKQACPGTATGVICSGLGYCDGGSTTASGKCICNAGYGSDSNCESCDQSHFGDVCQYACDGTVTASGIYFGMPCSGHGNCSHGKLGDGSCTCASGWAGETCAVQCPNGGNCGNNGTCHDGVLGDGTCTCTPGLNLAPPNCSTCLPEFTGSNCSTSCTSSRPPATTHTGKICSGQGVCVEKPDDRNQSMCVCTAGFQGRYCHLSCGGNPPCSGHGTCVLVSGIPVCDCDARWSGDALCATCSAATVNSTDCSVTCPVDAFNNVCGNQGVCVEGTCYCFPPFKCGTSCTDPVDQCFYCPRPFQYGNPCKYCPGVGPANATAEYQYACNGHGECDQGTSHSGACACYFGYVGSACELKCSTAVIPEYGTTPLICSGMSRGKCILNGTSPVCSCLSGFAGTACEIVCPAFEGLVCGGNGQCNRLTGLCKCNPQWTGTTCQVPCACNTLHGRCNDQACANYDSSSVCGECTCDGNFTGLCYNCRDGTQGVNCEGPCVNGTTVGTICKCFPNFGTDSCSVQCPLTNKSRGVLCSGHGYCSSGRLGDGTCHCNSSYYGAECDVYCINSMCAALMTNAVCSPGTGVCTCLDSERGHWSISASGQCDVCADGFWGPACSEVCSCNNQGSCNQNTGECQCYSSPSLGFYSGTSCDSCAVGYIGEHCDVASVLVSQLQQNVFFSNGSSVPSTIFVSPTGSPSTVPPRTPVLMVDDGTDFRQVFSGGSPVVVLDNTNVTGGGDFTFIGSTTTNTSTTNSVFSTSNCSTEINYVWRHANAIFFLVQAQATCNQSLRIISAPRATTHASIWGKAVLSWTMPFNVWSNMISGGVLRVRAAVSQSNTDNVMDRRLYRLAGNYLFFVLCNASFVASTGTTAWKPGGVLVVLKFDSDLNTVQQDTYVALPSTYYATDISVSPADLTLSPQQRIGISGYYNNSDGSMDWEVLWLSFTAGTVSSSFISANSLVTCWPPFPSSLSVTVGPTTATCGYCLYPQKLQLLNFDSFVITLRAASGSTVDTVVAWIGPTRSLSLSAPCANSTSVYSAFVGATKSDDSSATALAFDFYSNLVFVAIQMNNGNPSIMVKFLLSTPIRLVLNGNHSFVSLFKSSSTDNAEIISSLIVAPSSRLMFASTNYISQIRITTFLLYELVSLVPQITSVSNTMLTLVGRGFYQVQRGAPTCFFGSTAYTAAEIINATAVRCYVSNLSSNQASCQQQGVELSLFNPTFGATTNLLTVQRANVPSLTSCKPVRGSFVSQSITLFGVDFINSTYARCRFSKRGAGGAIEAAVYAVAVYVTPSQMTCVQPAMTVTGFKYLDLTLDLQVFTPMALNYVIVGEATNILASATSLYVTASDAVVFFPAVLNTVDNTGSPLGSLDTGRRQIVVPVNIKEVSTSPCSISDMNQWRSDDDGYPTACRPITINQQPLNSVVYTPVPPQYSLPNTTYDGVVAFNQTSYQGSVTFDGLYFYQPRAGAVALQFYAPGTSWSTSIVVTIAPGSPHALKIRNLQQFKGSNQIAIPAKPGTPLPDIIIVVIDAFANVIESNSVWEVDVMASVYFFPDNCSYVSPTSSKITPVGCMGFEFSTTQRFSKTSGTVPFSDKIALAYSLHGTNHYILFNSTSNPDLIPVVSPPIRTATCPDGSYKVPLATYCSGCPQPGGICPGSEIIGVRVGYWRADNASTYIYACDKLSPACNGSSDIRGSHCVTGSTGPLCSTCATYTLRDNNETIIQYWGKSKLTDCTVCESQAVNDALIAVVAIVVFVVVVIWSFCTLRTENTTDVSVVLRTVVNHMQATGELGQLSTKVGPFVKSVFSVSGGASTVSVQAVQFFDCFQKQHGLSFHYFFYGIMCLPILAVPVAFCVYGVIRILQLTPMLSPELRKEIDLQEQHLGPNGAFVSLKRKYPLFMVFTTTFSVIIFTIYQTLIAQSTSVLLCKQFVMSESYLSDVPFITQWFLNDDMSVECSTSGLSPFFLPGQVFAIGYGFGIPLLFVFGYRFMNGRLGMPALTNFMFLFLCGGYKKQYWYWQALIMIRKLLLVLVRVFITAETVQSAAGMWIMSMALTLQLWLKPAEKDEHNQVEAISLAVITLTLNLGLIYFWPDLSPSAELALNVILIIITFGCFIVLAVFLVNPILGFLKEIGRDIRLAVAGIKKQELQLRERRKKEKQRRKMILNKAGVNVNGDDEDIAEDEFSTPVSIASPVGGNRFIATERYRGSSTGIDFDFEEADPHILNYTNSRIGDDDEDLDDEEMEDLKGVRR